MKRYNGLYQAMYDMTNIREAHKHAKKGKLHYREVGMIDADPEKYMSEIKRLLELKIFQNSPYTLFQKLDRSSNKIRIIHKLPYFPDRIIHHCIVQILEPIWMKTLIKDTYSSLKGRGIHAGVKRLKVAIKDVENTRYCLKMDVKQFYPSIDHEILMSVIESKIKDRDVLWLLRVIVDSHAPGVPIGNYLSQFFGNIFLSGLDHMAKEVLGCKYYFRYCDDIVILGPDKEWLHQIRKDIQRFLQDRLKLELKGNYQIFPVDSRGIDFLGYRFFHGYTLLRKSIANRFKQKMMVIHNKWETMPDTQIVNSVMSYKGWMCHANCKRLSEKYIDWNIFNKVTQKEVI